MPLFESICLRPPDSLPFYQVHCSIGSARGALTGGGDYVVTSTLASQCPPAVGRALAFSLAESLGAGDDDDDDGRNATRPLSFVTIGDGSVHNAHFLSAFNLASHARYRRKKCPVVFGVSDNGLSISYSTAGYADYLFSSNSQRRGVPRAQGSVGDRDGVPIFKANGCDMMDVYDKTLRASTYSR
jgi:TPP-dependent pyruvate/acetoin dehydrogenase alpha subunit